jgi:hypothetical protein
MAETIFLRVPWDIIIDKDEIESLILELQIQISNHILLA